MIVVATEVSKTDKQILLKIYNELEKITIPTTFRNLNAMKGHYHAERTGCFDQKGARQTCFGQTRWQGRYIESKSSQKHPHMMRLFKEFIDSHYPEFTFRSVYVNKNTVCKKHLDSQNTGESLLIGFGDYTGGETTLHNEDEGSQSFDISKESIIFDGSVIYHNSEPFEGTRYSLVFFN
jgi:hypothetical protein